MSRHHDVASFDHVAAADRDLTDVAALDAFDEDGGDDQRAERLQPALHPEREARRIELGLSRNVERGTLPRGQRRVAEQVAAKARAAGYGVFSLQLSKLFFGARYQKRADALEIAVDVVHVHEPLKVSDRAPVTVDYQRNG